MDSQEYSIVIFQKEWNKLNDKGILPLDSSSIEKIDIKVNLISGGISKIE